MNLDIISKQVMLIVILYCFKLKQAFADKLPKHTAATHFQIYNRIKMTIEMRRALGIHRKVIENQRKQSTTPSVKGKYANKILMLQNYVGELLIMLFEERQAQLIKDLCKYDQYLRNDARYKIKTIFKRQMIDLLHMQWSEFLEVH